MSHGFGSPVLDVACRLLDPFMWLFAGYVLVHGHESPGGGFQAGVILAASFILIRLVRGGDTPEILTTEGALTLACLGPLLYGGIGMTAMLFGGNFLDYGALPLPLETVEVRVVGTLGIEVGVTVGVTGVLLLIYDTLADWGSREETDR